MNTPHWLESLEPRIAPAALVNGANLLGGADNPSTGEASEGEAAVTVVKVTGGSAIVWYDSLSNDITAISVGPGVSLEIFGDVSGDIVANLTADGELSDSDNDPSNGQDGGVLLPNNINSLKINKTLGSKGSVGSILTGGSISNVSVDGELAGIYAGDGVFHPDSRLGALGFAVISAGVDINPLDGIFNSVFLITEASAMPASGAGVNTVSVQTGNALQIIAGGGFNNPTGAGQSGGSISNITIQTAVADSMEPASYELIAGDGGDGLQGGAGGSISSVTEGSSSKQAFYLAGDGGDGSAGNGGAGGSVTKVDAQSDQTSYSILAGIGGQGTSAGGNGGSVSLSNFSGTTTRGAVVIMAEFTGDLFEDVLTVDTASGNMVVMQNVSGGSTFEQVIQDGGSSPFITPVGLTPNSAASTDIDGDGDVDFLVGYANSGGLGVYLNDGAGIFTGSFFDTDIDAIDIVTGEFLSVGVPSVAILGASAGSTSVTLAQWNSTTSQLEIVPNSLTISQSGSPVDIERARINSDLLDDLFVGFDNGRVVSVAALGSIDTPLQNTGVTQILPSRLTNLSVDHTNSNLLAFHNTTRALAISSFSTGALVPTEILPDLTPVTGQLLTAKYAGLSGDIMVQGLQKGISQITRFTNPDPTEDPWSLERTVSSTAFLKTFATTSGGAGLAAVTSSLDTLSYNLAGTSFVDSVLPFSGKSVAIFAGDGGNGGTGKGGNGGAVSSLAVEAADLIVTTGDGGSSNTSSGGAGGNLSVGGQFSAAGTAKYTALLNAKQSLAITTGDGGVSSGASSSANGGKGGDITALTLQSGDSDITILTGVGGSAVSGKGGNGGNLSKLSASTTQSNLSIQLGNGGDSTAGSTAGNGGSVSGFSFSQLLSPTIEVLLDPFLIEVQAGNGGDAPLGKAGQGGFLKDLTADVDPSDSSPSFLPDGTDSTTTIVFRSGNGGSGATGGNGGSITNTTADALPDQTSSSPTDPSLSFTVRNFAVMVIEGGNGGEGSTGNGGAGGSVTTVKAKGMTLTDPDAPVALPGVTVSAGHGGSGTVSGGHGGSISAVTSSNSTQPGGVLIIGNMLASAELTAGDGGNGGSKSAGNGGTITNARIAAAGVFSLPNPLAPTTAQITGGFITASAGQGGDATSGVGGAGGSIRGGYFGSLVAGGDFAGPAAPTVTLLGGDGGSGLKTGGVGGVITGLQVSSPQVFGQGTDFGARAITGPVLIAGDGGDATSTTDIKSKAGAGGSVTNITQPKDFNSFISLIQAGNGGDAVAGLGGNGGDVISIRTAGFIGQPVDVLGARLGVFNNGDPQGIFAGAGGSGGAGDGVAGKIANIVARQIAALGGAPLAGGLFSPASSISSIRADLIGFDVGGDGNFDSTSGSLSPTLAEPVDGFLLANTVSGILKANPARTAAFTFTA